MGEVVSRSGEGWITGEVRASLHGSTLELRLRLLSLKLEVGLWCQVIARSGVLLLGGITGIQIPDFCSTEGRSDCIAHELLLTSVSRIAFLNTEGVSPRSHSFVLELSHLLQLNCTDGSFIREKLSHFVE